MPSTADSPASKPPTTRLKLTMPSPTHSANVDGLAASPRLEHNARRPSYSPVTPPFPAGTSDVQAEKRQQPEFIEEPVLLPVGLNENSDAIALKAALSILQLQKQQSQRDIKQLDKMRAAASEAPEAFVDALKAGKLNKAPPRSLVDLDDEAESDEEKPDNRVADSDKSERHCDFGQFPNPQSVIRAPPINWAKYHIVGKSLDKLHDEQRQRPEPGSPRRDEYGRPPEHVIAAPYRPFVDKLEPVPDSTRKESKE